MVGATTQSRLDAQQSPWVPNVTRNMLVRGMALPFTPCLGDSGRVPIFPLDDSGVHVV